MQGSDLKERLRKAKVALFDGEEEDWQLAAAAIDDAISAISTVDQLAEALRRVADLDIVEASLDPGWFRRHARAALAALEQKP